MPARGTRRLLLWLAGAVVAVAVLITGGTYLYIHVIEGPAPAPLSLRSGTGSGASSPGAGGTSGAPAPAAGVAGRWVVSAGSAAGYRVKEVLFGQDNIAVGRTSHITGSIVISGGKVASGQFTVQMATVRSDESQRDVQFNGRIMQTSTYPLGTLTLTRPIAITPVPASGVIRSYPATGRLTLHGRTRPVTFTLRAERTSSGIAVSGSIPILFADYGISNPGFGGAITVQNHGLMEFLLRFRHG